MKFKTTFAAAIGTLTLAACSQPAETPDETVTETEVAETATIAVDGQPLAGSYSVTGADGSTASVTLTEDGKATYTAADGTVSTGTYTGGTAEEPYCVTGDESGNTSCYTQSMVDGVWTSTSVEDPERVGTVTRVAAE